MREKEGRNEEIWTTTTTTVVVATVAASQPAGQASNRKTVRRGEEGNDIALRVSAGSLLSRHIYRKLRHRRYRRHCRFAGAFFESLRNRSIAVPSREFSSIKGVPTRDVVRSCAPTIRQLPLCALSVFLLFDIFLLPFSFLFSHNQSHKTDEQLNSVRNSCVFLGIQEPPVPPCTFVISHTLLAGVPIILRLLLFFFSFLFSPLPAPLSNLEQKPTLVGATRSISTSRLTLLHERAQVCLNNHPPRRFPIGRGDVSQTNRSLFDTDCSFLATRACDKSEWKIRSSPVA